MSGPVLATLRVTTSSGPVGFDAAIPLRQRRGRRVGHLRGPREAVLQEAALRARSEGGLIAVVQASRGRYYLVPTHIGDSAGRDSIHWLKEMVDVPGVQTLTLWAETKGLVALVDTRRRIVTSGARTLIARG